MVSISDKILLSASIQHAKYISEIFSLKKEVLKLCLHYSNLRSKSHKKQFDLDLAKINGSDIVKVQSINWFLKKSTKKTKKVKGEYRNIKTITKTDNFFISKFRLFPNNVNTINELTKQLNYFNTTRIGDLLIGKPSFLIKESDNYKLAFSKKQNTIITQQTKRLISFLFDYSEFSIKNSSMYSLNWGAYKLTDALGVRSCLYCNRNYTLTVTNCGEKIIRPELDHFFPQSKYPLLTLSFYNLIPSCHICNSNLKGKIPFELTTHFHPYLSSFEKENAKFTYEPKNPLAFFGDKRGLKLKIDTSNLLRNDNRIKKNIEIFKLDYIYNDYQDIVDGFINLQRKTNKKKIKDIYRNVFVDNAGKRWSYGEQELYELAIRNHYNPDDFNKKPLAKFEKDIAKELGLIKKK
ncbi:hypothetical protein [Polaribacter sp. NJDZ03]|uniref:hypothetical protein n=1 Tax=Polaribacter sp. NJDZ03 TaxID=2855841 RepID=UPI001C4A6FC7|nr:hypothetical protein [Polaribacter sp. NJDZ03]